MPQVKRRVMRTLSSMLLVIVLCLFGTANAEGGCQNTPRCHADNLGIAVDSLNSAWSIPATPTDPQVQVTTRACPQSPSRIIDGPDSLKPQPCTQLSLDSLSTTGSFKSSTPESGQHEDFVTNIPTWETSLTESDGSTNEDILTADTTSYSSSFQTVISNPTPVTLSSHTDSIRSSAVYTLNNHNHGFVKQHSRFRTSRVPTTSLSHTSGSTTHSAPSDKETGPRTLGTDNRHDTHDYYNTHPGSFTISSGGSRNADRKPTSETAILNGLVPISHGIHLLSSPEGGHTETPSKLASPTSLSTTKQNLLPSTLNPLPSIVSSVESGVIGVASRIPSITKVPPLPLPLPSILDPLPSLVSSIESGLGNVVSTIPSITKPPPLALPLPSILSPLSSLVSSIESAVAGVANGRNGSSTSSTKAGHTSPPSLLPGALPLPSIISKLESKLFGHHSSQEFTHTPGRSTSTATRTTIHPIISSPLSSISKAQSIDSSLLHYHSTHNPAPAQSGHIGTLANTRSTTRISSSSTSIASSTRHRLAPHTSSSDSHSSTHRTTPVGTHPLTLTSPTKTTNDTHHTTSTLKKTPSTTSATSSKPDEKSTSASSSRHSHTGTAQPDKKNTMLFGNQLVHPQSVGGVVIGVSAVIYILTMSTIYVFLRRKHERENGIPTSLSPAPSRRWNQRERRYGRL